MKLSGDRNQCQGCKQYFNSSHAIATRAESDRTGSIAKRIA